MLDAFSQALWCAARQETKHRVQLRSGVPPFFKYLPGFYPIFICLKK
jgi:hypothetical protein